MTDDNGVEQRGDQGSAGMAGGDRRGEVRKGGDLCIEDIDLSAALGAKQPLHVDEEFMSGSLRSWALGDERRDRLLRSMYLAHLRPTGDDGAPLAGCLLVDEQTRELACDLAEFVLACLPELEFDEQSTPDDVELCQRMWELLISLAEALPELLRVDAAPSEGELEVEVELQPSQEPGRDRPVYSEAEFWAATEQQKPQRPPRAASSDHDGGRLASESCLHSLFSGSGAPDDTQIPGATPLVECSKDGSELAYLPSRTLKITREMRRRHTLVVGPTGTGKTTRLILPMLRSDIANPDLTVVVLDTKGELLPSVRSFMEEYRPGEEVILINFRDPERSLGWNPLEQVETSSEAFELAYNLCHAIEKKNSSSTESPFWVNSSIDLLSAMFMGLKQELGDCASIADALRLTDLSVAEFNDFAERFDDIKMLKRFASYVGTGSHNAETILADLRMRLVLFRDERVCSVLSKNELDFSQLATTPSVVVLQIPEEDVEELKPITNAWLDQLFAAELKVARKSPGLVLPVQLSLYLEEFASSVGRIPKFERRLNTCRQPGISVTASVQSLSQIEDEYGKASRSILAGFSTKVLLADCLIEDAQWFSASAGDTTVLEGTTTTQEGGQLESLLGRKPVPLKSRSERPVERALLSSSQLQRPLANHMLGRATTWFVPGLPPFQAFLTPIYMLEGGVQLMQAAAELGGPGELRDLPLCYETNDFSKDDAGSQQGKDATDNPSRFLEDGSKTERGLQGRLTKAYEVIELSRTTGSALKWWKTFEAENRQRPSLVVRLAEELVQRKATITEFFSAYVHSNTDNIQANLHYLDYTRLKRREEELKRERARNEARSKSSRKEEPDSSAKEMKGKTPPEVAPIPEEGTVIRPEPTREELIRHWLILRRKRDMTYAEAARVSGFSVGTLRYWRKKLGL